VGSGRGGSRVVDSVWVARASPRARDKRTASRDSRPTGERSHDLVIAHRSPEPTPNPSGGGEPDSEVPLLGGVWGGFRPWWFTGSGFGVGGASVPASEGQADGLAGLSAHRGERASFQPFRFMPAHLNTFRVAGV